MPVFDEPFSDVISESLESLELTGVLEEVALHALSLPGKEEVLAACRRRMQVWFARIST